MWTIYCHRHEASGRRYIGQTNQTMMKRWRNHVRAARGIGCGWFFAAAIAKYGPDSFSHLVLEMCETLESANEAEAAWIESFSTRNSEFGFNLLAGGKRLTVPQSKDSSRAKMSESRKRALADPEKRAVWLAALRTPEVSAKHSANAKAQWLDPDIRSRNMSGLRGSHTEEGKRRSVEARRNPETIAQMRAKAIERWQRPEYREKMAASQPEAQRKVWAREGFRERQSDAHRKR